MARSLNSSLNSGMVMSTLEKKTSYFQMVIKYGSELLVIAKDAFCLLQT